MSKENEAHRDWQVKPCDNPIGWFSVGYTYEGNQGQHQGEFVPVHHWSDREQAEAFQRALLAGEPRHEAEKAAKEEIL